MLLKSFSGDAHYAKRLLESFAKFNVEGIPLFIVVPESDLEMFEAMQVQNCTLLSEDLFERHLVDQEVHGIRPGYINQEIIKLAFWELELAANYFCVDSDAEFIREFRVSDFMFDSLTPFSVLVQDLELAVDPEYYHQYWKSREREIARIAQLIGWESPVILTCHGHTVLSKKVLESFVDEFLVPRGWEYRDALEQSPYEFSWYNIWLQKSCAIDVHPREPWIKVFHSESRSECLGDELAACSTVDEGSALVSLHSGLEDEEVGVADLCDLHVSALLVARPASTLGWVLRSGERGGVGVLGLLCRGLSLEGLEGFLRAGGTGTC